MGRGKSSDEKIENLGATLRWLREDQRLLQEEAAAAAGMSKAYYGQLERGERYPSEEAMDSLCTTFGTDIERVKSVAMSRPWEQLPYLRKPLGSSYRTRKIEPDIELLASSSRESMATDTASAELLAIYNKLGPTEKITVLTVARSLGKHL